ncbi:hypothetical protein FUAX_45020 (plasmid) [Fulvitalea axinellae]|uniref:DUF2947 family protein n=1 Tax=Fulvitalea axinellae TaxID=1182444 RepID=A0AAU9DLL1_9BACT|nr:hypothetical protein FUAX_45020 [Fulvitalea axinellae]
MKIEIKDEEVIPLSDFELNWRWDKIHNSRISIEELKEIQPLSHDTSKKLFKVASYFESELDLRNDYTSSDWIRASSESDDHTKEFRKKLSKLLKNWNEDLIVCWDKKTSLKTNKEIFLKYWDDFCYPSSDDLIILSVKTNWILIYNHIEVAKIWMKIDT